MPLSYRNIIDTNQLADALTTGDYSKVIKKKNQNLAKYVKGYAQDSAIEALANSIDPNMNLDLFRKAMGIENKKLDEYDPYHTSDAKKEEFWYNTSDTKVDGKSIQSLYDEDTNLFKRGLYENTELGGYGQNDYWYEDPFLPTFELFFDDTSPFFIQDNTTTNSLSSFLNKYSTIDQINYNGRRDLWLEFKKVFFKIFETKYQENFNRNKKNKTYYITKIAGLNNLNKKIINFGEDKLTITLNEDVSMFVYYLSELYNNLIYSYKNKRYMFPENVLRFNMTIIINDMRIFQIPQSANNNAINNPINKNYLDNRDIKNIISPKSQIIYTLHDCSFNFSESRNYGDEIVLGGYGESFNQTPQTLSFDIFYKSVTRSSTYPLIQNSISIDAWQSMLFNQDNDNTESKYFQELKRVNSEKQPESKSFLNKLLSKGTQTVVNAAANYVDNLETKLREVRGSAVNNLLIQFRNSTKINRIEPDNIYSPDFNNRASVKNFGDQIASGLLNDLEDTLRGSANF